MSIVYEEYIILIHHLLVLQQNPLKVVSGLKYVVDVSSESEALAPPVDSNIHQ